MVFKAKNGSKWKHHWSWPFLHISIELLVLVAGRISANHRISGLTGKAGQEFSPKIVYFWRSKMFLHICTVGLGSTNSASEVGMVENVKLNHDLDTNFCNFSPFLRHSAMAILYVIISITTFENRYKMCANIMHSKIHAICFYLCMQPQ